MAIASYPEMACGGNICPGNPVTCKKPCDFGSTFIELVSRAPKLRESGDIIATVAPARGTIEINRSGKK